MKNDTNHQSSSRALLPYILMAVAFACAVLFVNTEVEPVRRYAAGSFGMALGAALLLWGVDEYRAGQIRGTRIYVHRASHPAVFFLLLAGKRWFPGGIMLLAGFWYAFIRSVA